MRVNCVPMVKIIAAGVLDLPAADRLVFSGDVDEHALVVAREV